MGLEVCVARLADSLEPPPRQTVSEWADQNRRLSSESSAERGEWRTDRAPYQRAIMDALSPYSPYERIVVMSSSQIGKTEILNNFVGYIVDRDPGPLLVVQPRVEDGKSWSKDRLAPMLRDTPCLRGKVSDVRTRDANNTTLHKRFPGGHITIAGANSAAGLAARPIRYVLLDEVDRYPASAGTEGDPVALAIKRTATFWNRKIVMVSSPTVKAASRVEAAWLKSNRQSYWVPCPECGHFQILRWPSVEWPDTDPAGAAYLCEHCAVHIPAFKKPWMLARGEWRPANPGSKVAGFWINQLYSPWKEWGETAAEFLDAKESPETLRTFINTALGEPWDDEAHTSVDLATLIARREHYGPKLPGGVALLTCGVDVQADRLEVELVGWGRGEESWSVAYQVLPGDPSAPAVWQSLDELLAQPWTHERRITLPVSACCIDSGFHTQQVYEFARDRFHQRVFAIKGKAGPLPVWPKRPSRKNGTLLYTVGVDSAKSTVYGRLKIVEPSPGFCHFPADRSREYFEQLLSEILVTTYSRGAPVREWRRKKATRGEALDCRVYAFAALQALISMGLSLDREAERLEALAANAHPPAAGRVARSRWMQD